MLIFKHNKNCEAAFLPHLDTLRAIIRTVKRAGIEVNYSQGYNPHMNLYMSPPVPLGIESLCEYCAVDTSVSAADFMQMYNSRCLKGLICTAAWETVKNPNTAANMTAAKYFFESSYLNENFDKIDLTGGFKVTTEKEGRIEEKDARDGILSMEKAAGGIFAVLKFGNSGNLRSDKFAAALKVMLGDFSCGITKVEAYCGNLTAEDFIKQYLP